LGIQFKNFTLDYALTDIGDQAAALYSNIFSLKVGLQKSKHSKARNSYE